MKRPLAIRKLVPMLPKGEDRTEAFLVSGYTIVGELLFGSFDKARNMVNYPAAKRIRRIAEFKLANEFLAKCKNRIRRFGCGRRL